MGLTPKPNVSERNAIAAEIMADSNVPVDDLFDLVKDHPEYYKPDGVHFTPAAAATQAKQVAAKILQLMQ